LFLGGLGTGTVVGFGCCAKGSSGARFGIGFGASFLSERGKFSSVVGLVTGRVSY
jgi:hypothetical protein